MATSTNDDEKENCRLVMTDIKKEISAIEEELSKLPSEISNLDILIKKAMLLYQNSNKIWASADFETKIGFQTLMFPDGIKFDGRKRQFLTDNINNFYTSTVMLTKDLDEKKKGRTDFLYQFPPLVAKRGVEPLTSGL